MVGSDDSGESISPQFWPIVKSSEELSSTPLLSQTVEEQLGIALLQVESSSAVTIAGDSIDFPSIRPALLAAEVSTLGFLPLLLFCFS